MNLSVPKTRISGTINGQPFDLASPKDCELVGLDITAQTGGLTNYARIHIEKVVSRMNPEVITTTADGQVKQIREVAEQIRATAAQAK